MKYAPLVKNIATYFFNINCNVELDDLIQEGWHGLLMAYKKYDPTKGVSLGAYAQRYIFGRIYRSLLGTKNLQYQKKIILLECSEKVIDKHQTAEEFILHLYDHIHSQYNHTEQSLLNLYFQNFKKTEILKTLKITSDFYDNVIIHFRNNFD